MYQQNKVLPYVAIILANLFFAINMSAAKHLTYNNIVGAYAINIFRVGIALILMWTLLFFAKDKKLGILKKDIGRFILCAACGVGLNQTFFIKGLSLTHATHAALLLLATPILISMAAIYFLKERFRRNNLVGLLLGLGGALILMLQKESSGMASNVLLGDIFVIINAIVYACYFILVKPLMLTYNPVHVIRWVFTFGFIMVLPIGIGELQQVKFSNLNSISWLCLGELTLLGTFCTYLFTIYSIKHLGAATSGNFIYTQPIFAAIIAWLFLNDNMDLYKSIAGAFIFLGVYFTHKSKK
jgi:drug/metabolite transporter (DMT)-like permease